MKTACLALVIFVAAAAQQPPKPAVVDGKAVNSTSGELLRKVEVTLATNLLSDQMEAMMSQFGLDPDAPAAGKAKPVKKTFTVTTDASGKFHFEVEPGDYYLNAKRSGFVDFRYKPQGKWVADGKVHLTAGDELTGVEFKMVPQGAVSGRVIDEDGDPVTGATVTAQSYGYANGKRRLAPADFAMVNDRGEFRLGKLPPGHYYLSANLQNFNAIAETPPPPKDGSPETGYVTTYFPKATDLTLASAIDVAAAADLSGFVIQLQKARVVRIKGKAVDADGKPIRSAQVMLMSTSGVGAMQMRMINDPQGRFELAGLQPGSYTIMTMQMGGGSPTINMQPVVVPAEGLDNLQLGGQADGSVSGTVSAAGEGKVSLKDLQVMLGGDEAMVLPSFGRASESGAFTLNKVSPARYQVTVPHMPEGAYLKSVQWNGRETLGKPVDFSAGFSGALAIVLGTDGGAFDATVTRDDKPLSGATVVLLPADQEKRLEVMTRHDDTDATGRISLKDIPPGDYLAFAWEDVEEGAWLDPTFLQPLESRAVKVTIGAKAHEKADLKPIPAGKK